jgi:hypothetical protein
MVKPTRDWSPGESAIFSGVFFNLRGRKGEEVEGRSSFAPFGKLRVCYGGQKQGRKMDYGLYIIGDGLCYENLSW